MLSLLLCTGICTFVVNGNDVETAILKFKSVDLSSLLTNYLHIHYILFVYLILYIDFYSAFCNKSLLFQICYIKSYHIRSPWQAKITCAFLTVYKINFKKCLDNGQIFIFLSTICIYELQTYGRLIFIEFGSLFIVFL